MATTMEQVKRPKTYLLEVLHEYRKLESNITDIIDDTGYKSQFIAKRLRLPLSTFYLKRKTKSFTSAEVSKIVNMMTEDETEEDAALLELAKSRMDDDEISADEFISYLRK